MATAFETSLLHVTKRCLRHVTKKCPSIDRNKSIFLLKIAF